MHPKQVDDNGAAGADGELFTFVTSAWSHADPTYIYDNTTTGFTATDLQAAIDELHAFVTA